MLDKVEKEAQAVVSDQMLSPVPAIPMQSLEKPLNMSTPFTIQPMIHFAISMFDNGVDPIELVSEYLTKPTHWFSSSFSNSSIQGVSVTGP